MSLKSKACLVVVLLGLSLPGSTYAQEQEKDIARQWKEIHEKYPEAARLIAQALVYAMVPLPADYGQDSLSVKRAKCATALLLATKLSEGCRVNLGEVKLPDRPAPPPPPGCAECLTACALSPKPAECVMLSCKYCFE
jgi:hypothetical protein